MSYFEIKYRDQLYADSVNACLRFNKVKPSYFHDLALVKLLKKTNKQNRETSIFTPILIDYFINRGTFIA